MNLKPVRKPPDRLKRIMDVSLCILGLPLVLPIAFMVALLIKMDSKGPALYAHERIGKNGKRFQIYKFRTMTKNADALLQKYLEDNPQLAREWAETQKLRKDPRITRLGHFLRKTSLDELPQIINILAGDMSLVGPRPIVENEIAKYGRYFDDYCSARPGLTGLWQTSGRNTTSYTQRVAYDHYYVNNWTIWLDLWILAKTVPVTISGKGAY